MNWRQDAARHGKRDARRYMDLAPVIKFRVSEQVQTEQAASLDVGAWCLELHFTYAKYLLRHN